MPGEPLPPSVPLRFPRGPIARNRRRREVWALVLLAVADVLLWAALG